MLVMPEQEDEATIGRIRAFLASRPETARGEFTLDILDGQIQTIRTVTNPDKLGHVGPVADAWAVAREANQARQPTD